MSRVQLALNVSDLDEAIDFYSKLFASEPQPCLDEQPGNGRFLLFRVGDCISMHNIHGAIYDALRLCKDF